MGGTRLPGEDKLSSRVSIQTSNGTETVTKVYCSSCGGFLGQEKVLDGICVFYCRKCKIRAIVLAGSMTSLTADQLSVMIGEQ